MGFLGFIIVAVLAFFIVGFIWMSSNSRKIRKATGNDEDTNRRFKEAAEKGTDPKTVIGFFEIEDNPTLKDSKTHQMVKDICIELAKSGYWMEPDRSIGDYATINVYPNNEEDEALGNICFWVKREITQSRDYHLEMKLIENRNTEEELCHKIIDDGFTIESEAALPEPPPEWLIICADVIKTYSPPLSDPEWLRKYPEAKRYINAMF